MFINQCLFSFTQEVITNISQPIQLIIHGTGAQPAFEELQTLSGLTIETGHAESAPTRSNGIDVLTTIANVVKIASGTLATAELIRQWYLGWREGKEGKQIDKVVIYDGENRHLLKNCTAKEIANILAAL